MISINNNELAIAIKNALIRSGNFRVQYATNDFLQDELDSIKAIGLYNLSSLVGIENLRSLETLSIYNSSTTINQGMLNRITDFSLINQLTKLRKLYILNDINIEKLDVSSLDDLEELVLVSNPNLKEIIGINALKKLGKLVVVGNDSRCYVEIDQYLKRPSSKAILDISLYQKLFIKSAKSSEYSQLARRKGIIFAEKIGFGEIFALSFEQIRDMFNKYNKILKSLINPEFSEQKKVEIIYYFVVSYLSYDSKGLEKRNRYFMENDYKPLLDNNIMRNFRKMNTSYGALYSRCVVCEGYVNMMRFFLNLLNINSRTVYCYLRKEPEFKHTAIAILLNDEWIFTDPQKFGFSRQKIFRTKEEFLEEYILSPMDMALYEKEDKEIKY